MIPVQLHLLRYSEIIRTLLNNVIQDGKHCVTSDSELFPSNGDFQQCTKSFFRYIIFLLIKKKQYLYKRIYIHEQLYDPEQRP